jgi:hypothetical protein
MADNSKLAEALMSDNYGSDQNTLKDYLSRLQLSGGFNATKQPGVNSIGGGGRVGYNFPMDGANLNAGVGASGYKTNVDVPGFKQTFKDFGVNGVDAAYSNGYSQYYPQGQNTIGGNYQINPNGQDGFNAYYKRNF